MHRSAPLTIVALLALATPASAGAATTALGHLYIANYPGRVPARVATTLPGSWSAPVAEDGLPVLGRQEQRTDLGAGATCIRSVTFVGTTMSSADRPVYTDGGLRLPRRNGWLLPRLAVTRRGTAGAVRWYAGRIFAPEIAPGVLAPTVQGLAILPAPAFAVRAGGDLVVVRVLVSANVQKVESAPDGGVGYVPPTPEEAGRCFPPARRAMPALLRSALRHVRIVRRTGQN